MLSVYVGPVKRFFWGTVLVCPQFPYRGNDMIFWIFPAVLCHALCMWHWPICKNLNLSFIWGHHHLHLVGMDNQSISWLLHNSLHRADRQDPARSKQLSMVAILVFQFGLYHVVAPSSFLHSISLASLFSGDEHAWKCCQTVSYTLAKFYFTLKITQKGGDL